jgi:hypothetical protein
LFTLIFLLVDVNVPEKDINDEVFELPGTTNIDVEAKDFEALCQKLGV